MRVSLCSQDFGLTISTSVRIQEELKEYRTVIVIFPSQSAVSFELEIKSNSSYFSADRDTFIHVPPWLHMPLYD